VADEVDFVSDLNSGDVDTAESHGSIPVNAGDVPVNAVPAVREVQPQPIPVQDRKESGDKPLSLRDQISSALKGDGTDTPPVARQDGRNPDGTFAAKQPAVVDPNAAAPAGAPVATPRGLDQATFQTLPAETQAMLARTMGELEQARGRYAQLDQVEQLIGPRRQAWALNGMTESSALGQLLALSDFAGRDPKGFIKYMAENSGVDLAQLVYEQPIVDPGMTAMQAEIASLKQQLTGFNTQQQQAAHTATVNEVIAFASEKGGDGHPLRPYFDELGHNVLPFIEAVRSQNPSWSKAQILQTAYENACWGTPSVRAKLQSAANAVGDAERIRMAAEKGNRAKAASVSVRTGSPASPGTPPDTANKSLRDTIRASISTHT
jgi:hypothetical protein